MTFDEIDQVVRQANPVPDPTALEPVEGSVLVDRAAGVNDGAGVHQLERRLGRSRLRRAGGEITDQRRKVLWLRRNGPAAPPAEFDPRAAHLDGLEQDDAEGAAVDGELTPDDDPTDGRRSRGRLVAAGLVLALVAAVSVVAVLRDGEDPTTGGGVTSDGQAPEPLAPKPSAPDAPARHFPLPPEGSAPSAPEHGEVVLTLGACGGPSAIGGWSGRLHLYEDGRLIRLTYGDPVEDPEGGNGPRPSTGWIEQRLTPEGVELMRSAVASSGLRRASSPGEYCNSDWYQVTLREGAQSQFFQSVLPPDLLDRMSDPASWLPPTAWEDRRARPFVPTGYVVAFWGLGQRPDMASITAALPTEVRPSIRARDWGENASGPAWIWMAADGMTTEQARALVEALAAGGVEQSDHPTVPGPVYVFDHPEPRPDDPLEEYIPEPGPAGDEIQLTFDPLLPG